MSGKNWIQSLMLGLGVAVFTSQFGCPAQGATPEQIAARSGRMDTYFLAPRSPQLFRALSGLDDPQIESAESNSLSRWWSATPVEKAQLKLLFPDLDISQQYFYPDLGSCRVGSPLEILMDRMRQLGANHPYVRQWIAMQRVVLSACARSQKDQVTLPPPMTIG